MNRARFAKLFVIAAAALLLPVFACQRGEQKPQTEAAKSDTSQSGGSEENKSAQGGNPMVVMSTSMGDIKIELFEDKAPITVKNFLSYVNEGFFDGTVFHRVIKGFMVQGGGFTSDLQQKPAKAPIKNEADNGVGNTRGTLAMARTNVVDSATSQFFINLVDNAFLNNGGRDFGYAVFGRVVEGMDIVDKIAGVRTGRVGPMADVPVEPIVVNSAKLVGD
ncbi:MAG: peptidylprolyl isomerase [Deltaproteobacteria bacterium]